MKILLYGGCSVRDETKRDMTKLWARVTRRINPDVPIVLFDTASPIDPCSFLEPGILIHRFDDNPGHLSHGGGDGAGRTVCAGMNAAIAMGADWVIHAETDLLFVRPVNEVIARMRGASVGCLSQPTYQFYEWGFSVFNVRYLVESEFIARYDWQNAGRDGPIPEIKLEWLAGADLTVLPYRGMRTSGTTVTADNLAGYFPYFAPDWLHDHVTPDLSVMRAFLKMHGIAA